MKKLVLSAALILLVGCTDPDNARRVLAENGYTDVQIGGYAAWSCGRDDTYATEFVATSPTGHRVTGAVCSAWTKGATIRFY